MTKNNPRLAQGQSVGGLDILFAALHQGAAAHGTRIIGPLDGNQGDDDFIHSPAENRQQYQRDQNGRETELQIHQPHNEGIDASAKISRCQADTGAQAQRDETAHGADPQADAQSVEYGAEHIAALIVGAQPEDHPGHAFGPGRQAAIHDVYFCQVIRILGRDDRCKYRD